MVFSKAQALCVRQKLSGTYGQGWHSIGVDAPDLASGIYYYSVRVLGSKAAKVGKLAILR